ANSGVLISNGATLKITGNVTFPGTSLVAGTPNRRIDIGAGGGIIDTGTFTLTEGSAVGSSNAAPGIFSSVSAGLTKIGSGTLEIGKSPAGGLTYNYGGLTVLGGVVTISTDQDLGMVPTSTGVGPGNLTLNGGTLRWRQN